MTDQKLRVGVDFNETALDYVRTCLCADHLHQLRVFVSRSDAVIARRVQGLHGFELVVVPDYLLHNRHSWGAEFGAKAVWTEGCP